MPSTTIHFPDDLLTDIDRVVQNNKMSRNKFVIEACKAALVKDAGEWSEDFFSTELSVADKKFLAEASEEMVQVIYKSRRNRGAPLL